MDVHQQVFIEEAQELLDELEKSLLELQNDLKNKEIVSQIFRAMHTIKGSGSMFGFENIAHFMHDLETVYDKVRNGELGVNQTLINLSLSACDVIHEMLSTTDDQDANVSLNAQNILETLKSFDKQLDTEAAQQPEKVMETKKDQQEQKEEKPSTPKVFDINITFQENILENGTNPLLLISDVRELGTCDVFPNYSSLPNLSAITPESCYTSWQILLETEKTENDIKDIFIFVEDEVTLTINEIKVEENIPYENQQAAVQKTETKTSGIQQSTIRVSADKLDSLVDLVAEIVTTQARLSEIAHKSQSSELELVAEDVARLTSELRDYTLSLRMLPIGTLFGKFKRLVHDLSLKLDKEVNFITKGSETELDKTVLEKLNDPLVHLIRNSMDHGVESAEERIKAGKPEKGTVELIASHEGANVIITIKDDGSGFNQEKILAKAIEKKLVAPDAQLSEKEIFNLIFAPGFSTSENISKVSGRGVGMDVVRKAIDNLGGMIDADSVPGEGTTLTLKLPLTLAIIDGLLVKVEDEHFVIPLSYVNECVELTANDREKAHGKNVINVRDSIVPFISIREFFDKGEDRPTREQVVLLNINDFIVGFVVDVVIGGHQTVIKSLGKLYQNVEGLSGATIMGDGSVALIIDVPKIVKLAEIEELEFVNS